MYPILIEGTKVKYVPWGNRDLDGLVGKLPHLRDGASRWISVLESETMGQMLAVGDIKVVLTKSLTREEMEEALTAGGMAMAVGSQLYDGQEFNQYRNPLWRVLRTKYVTKMSKGDMITRAPTLTEHFETWLREQIQHWRDVANESVTIDPGTMQTQLFRGAVVDALPDGVQRKLTNVPGLDMMHHGQWAETLKHFFKAHQDAEKALDKQGTEVSRKLAQANLDQLKKLKGIGGVKSSPKDSVGAQSHGPAQKRSDTPNSAPAAVEGSGQTGDDLAYELDWPLGEKVPFIADGIVVRKVGAAVRIKDVPGFQVKSSKPHVTLFLFGEHRAKDMGEVVEKSWRQEWIREGDHWTNADDSMQLYDFTDSFVESRPRETPEEECRPGKFVVGDLVYVKMYRRKWDEPRREGPYRVARATKTAVQVDGSQFWFHTSHCTMARKHTAD
ncbi:hypothetical protein DPEC_G00063360 [Dallia pectoralis]|uniref:Uncharacterized protein n=1 Tax=Dallia pectoralis TaxID=75939 RepID=A0ACC2H7D7_DALPE|nr:hypothetical protein DPEC_G00063360 [Dallia pectoralis]